MRLIHLNWSYITGEGSVSYTKDFKEAHVVDQLDMLKDCIVDLTDKYNSLLSSDATDNEVFYGLPHESVSTPKVGGNDLTAGETAPLELTAENIAMLLKGEKQPD